MKPILFTKENRDKTRSGAKTQTRRVITDTLPIRARFDSHDDRAWQETVDGSGNLVAPAFGNEMWWEEVDEQGNPSEDYFIWQAPYRVGEIRYLCEPYVIDSAEHTSKRQMKGEYLDDGGVFKVDLTPAEWDRWQARKRPYDTTPARFMYKSLARTLVEIVDLRREPLQEISGEDAWAEGIAYDGNGDHDAEANAIDAYRTLWNTINARRGHAWESNPTVLVVEYKVVTP